MRAHPHPPSPAMHIVVGPSLQRQAWRDFQTSPDWRSEDFDALVASDNPGAVFFEIQTAINGLYRLCDRQQSVLRGRLDSERLSEMHGQTEMRARWLAVCADGARLHLTALEQREIDIGLLRWIRRAGCLTCVVGAGVTMDAGGPSWPALVRALLHTSLLGATGPGATGTPAVTPAQAHRASEIVRAIEAGQADTDMLMEGAELCVTVRGQHLFADITSLLYADGRQPGQVHRAIAALAAPLHVRERGGSVTGWAAVISYNFDDLLGEAIDALGLARSAYAMRGTQVAGDPNDLARAGGQHGLHQRILHLHGYTPRRLFLLTHIPFVFSATQYSQGYGARRLPIVDQAFTEYLDRPIFHAVYVGCSFSDQAMNGLLETAARALPGRMHYALLRWPGPQPLAEATGSDCELHGATYLAMGVRPLWFEQFDEIAGLINRLA